MVVLVEVGLNNSVDLDKSWSSLLLGTFQRFHPFSAILQLQKSQEYCRSLKNFDFEYVVQKALIRALSFQYLLFLCICIFSDKCRNEHIRIHKSKQLPQLVEVIIVPMD